MQAPSQTVELVIFDWGRTLYDPASKALFPEALEMLGYLSKRYQLAIVALATAGEEKIRERERLIDDYDLRKYFAAIRFATADKDKLYEETIKQFNLSPEKVAIVDDKAIRGVAWGNARGAMTIWFQNGATANEHPNAVTGKPTYTIRALGEIVRKKLL